MDREAWWATVHRVTRSRTWLKPLSTHACTQAPLGVVGVDQEEPSCVLWSSLWTTQREPCLRFWGHPQPVSCMTLHWADLRWCQGSALSGQGVAVPISQREDAGSHSTSCDLLLCPSYLFLLFSHEVLHSSAFLHRGRTHSPAPLPVTWNLLFSTFPSQHQLPEAFHNFPCAWSFSHWLCTTHPVFYLAYGFYHDLYCGSLFDNFFFSFTGTICLFEESWWYTYRFTQTRTRTPLANVKFEIIYELSDTQENACKRWSACQNHTLYLAFGSVGEFHFCLPSQ